MDATATDVVTATNITCTPPTTNNYSEVTTGVNLPAVVVAPVAQPIAFTGTDSQRMLGWAAILMGLGGLLLIAARRRRRQGLV